MGGEGAGNCQIPVSPELFPSPRNIPGTEGDAPEVQHRGVQQGQQETSLATKPLRKRGCHGDKMAENEGGKSQSHGPHSAAPVSVSSQMREPCSVLGCSSTADRHSQSTKNRSGARWITHWPQPGVINAILTGSRNVDFALNKLKPNHGMIKCVRGLISAPTNSP